MTLHRFLPLVTILSVLLLTTNPAGSQTKPKILPQETVLLYPEGQETDLGVIENGVTITLGPGESNCITETEVENTENGNLSFITSPRMRIYLPKKGNGQMLICCPGGGYSSVSAWNEGAYVADWMVQHGIALCVVEYRLPNKHWAVPLTDVQNAFRYCRAHAGQWGVNQIGVIGFSAGGHLAASASNLYVDEATRPDFSVLVYPVITMDSSVTHTGTHDNLIGKESQWSNKNQSVLDYEAGMAKYSELSERYSLEKQVTPDTPPTFLVHCMDDKVVPIENSIRYFDALRKSGVATEFQVYPHGGHGWGFTTGKFGNDGLGDWRETFFHSLLEWLENQRQR